MRAKYSIILIPMLLLSAIGGIKLAQYITNSKAGVIEASDAAKAGNISDSGSTEDNKAGNDIAGNYGANSHDEIIRITAVGDIMLGRGVGSRLDKKENGYIYAFEKVADILKEGDIVFGNLEGSISDRTHSLTALSKESKVGKYVLKNKVKAFEAIKYAGFNLLSLANNHILDYYDKALFDTFDILDANNIAYSGAGRNLEEARKPAIVEKDGFKVGLLSYTDMAEVVYGGNPSISFIASENKAGVAPRKLEYIFEDVSKLRPDVDILLVSFHWGIEESFNISQEQIDLAHRLIDLGVDAILGHHPHQFQGIEIYKGKPVIYSMGNFIFDQNDPENQESFIVNMDFSKDRLLAMNAIPVRTIEKSQVVPQTSGNADSLLKRETELCNALNTKCSIEDDMLVFGLQFP